jgi:type IV secretion system protein TrbE
MELASMSARLNQALCLLGSGWMLHCDALRRTLVGYPDRGAFPDRTTFLIDEERRLLYQCVDKRYETIYAITLTYLPDVIVAQKAQDLLYTNREKTSAVVLVQRESNT